MSTRRRDRKRVRLASPNQLWVLNRSGWLELRTTPVMDRLTSERADQAIQHSMRLEAEQDQPGG